MKKAIPLALVGQIGLFLLGIAGSLYAAMTPANSMVNWYRADDAFYYYKVAQNVLAGHGFTFDQVNLSNGFHPLWMVVCLGVFWLSRFHLLLPLRILIIISGLLNGATGVLLFRLLRKYLHPAAAVLGASVWMLLPSIYHDHIVHGMESALSALLIVWLLSKSVEIMQANDRRPVSLLLLGLLGALTILSRLDTVFIVAAIGVFVVFRITRIPRVLVVDLVLMLLAAVFAWVTRFGTTPTVWNNYSIYPLLLTGLVIKPLILFLLGFYSPVRNMRRGVFIVRLAVAFLLIGLLEYGVLLLLQAIGFNLLVARSLILLDLLYAALFITLHRVLRKTRDTSPAQPAWKTFSSWMKGNLKQLLRDGGLFSLPVALLIGAYMLANKLIFGTFSPISGQVKTWWGSLTNTVYMQNETLVGLLGLNPGSGNSPWSLLTTLVADIAVFLRNLFTRDSNDLPIELFLVLMFIIFAALVLLLSRKNGYLARKSFNLLVPALIIGCFLQISYYAARGYGHTRSWYWVAEALVLVMLGALFASRLFEKLGQWTRSGVLTRILLVLMTVVVFLMHTRYLVRQFPLTVAPEMETRYLAQALALEEYTEEGSLIGMTGGGMTAYFVRNRTVVNLDGLINSVEYFNALKAGKAAEFLDRMGLDYVFGNYYMLLDSNPYQGIFHNRLKRIMAIELQDRFVLYRYLPKSR